MQQHYNMSTNNLPGSITLATRMLIFSKNSKLSQSQTAAIEHYCFVLFFGNSSSTLSRKHVSVEWWWALRLKAPRNLLMQLSESIQESRSFTLTC